MKDDDQLYVIETLSGNGKSFEFLVDKYYKTVFRVASKLVRSNDDAEEITQIVFVKAYEKLSSFNPNYKFFSWLYKIAINESINFSKSLKYSEDINEQQDKDGNMPDEIYDKNELSDSIQNALMQIDMLYRIPVVLKHFLDYSYKEISLIIDVPEKTVKSRLFEGRQLLKEILIKNKVF
ncbi:MAG: RNA polymerase sigma factor [Ignavibacteriaceae bacterium]